MAKRCPMETEWKPPMDVFALRDKLVHDYATYIERPISIRDDLLHEHMERELDENLLQTLHSSWSGLWPFPVRR